MADIQNTRRHYRFQELAGKRYGRITVVRLLGREPGTAGVRWLCKCDCGKESTATTSNLNVGHMMSCGCAGRELAAEHARRLGKAKAKHVVVYEDCDGTTTASIRSLSGDEVGRFVIDTVDRRTVEPHLWFDHEGYIATYVNRRKVKLHAMLVGIRADHRNLDHYDNRRCNLRLATPCNQAANRRKPHRRTTSRFKGVSRHGTNWRASIGAGNRKYRLGTFSAEIEAARAYDHAARNLHMEFARLNFPAPGESEAIVPKGAVGAAVESGQAVKET